MCRDWLDAHGVRVDMNGIYTLQDVAKDGTQRGDGTGSLVSGDLSAKLDTSEAGLWPGGFFFLRLEGRAGNGIARRAGALAPTSNDALFPLVPGKLGDDEGAITELVAVQFLTKRFGLAGGLLNTTSGDANPIAGSLISNSHFFNSAFLFSPVEAGVIPSVAPGGGLIFLPSQNRKGSLIALGSAETAGENPFETYDGTTFLSEWAFTSRGGTDGMILGGLYSIGQTRRPPVRGLPTLIRDPRTGELRETDRDVWALYWNGFHYLRGDEKRGWGAFGRYGLSEGDPNPIAWSMAAGIGGVGLLPGRSKDRWGAGIYHKKYVDGRGFRGPGTEDETGGEVFYNIGVTSWMNVTLDVQVIDGAIPGADTAFVLGSRVAISF